ncbi:unnamed protein product [Rotaria sp. Silwood1]|nr:unnamed protein product [Rotaria sp. Silwood1]
MNIAFSYASKIFAPMFNCFIFHDGDLIPENDYNIYECDQHGPRHLAPAVNELRYSLRQVGYGVNRPPNNVGRYKMIRYEKQIPSFNRFKTLSKWLRYSSDGIRQLSVSILRWDLTRLLLGYQQEYDSIMSIVVVKFLVSSLLLFGYTCQLCLTTMCTSSIYFNWFLIVTDCRYIYSYILWSYPFAGCVLISLSWTVISLLHLVVYRFRS